MRLLFCLLLAWSNLLNAEAPFSPQDSGDAPLSFESALQKIIFRSTLVASQRMNLEATRARNLQSHASLLPKIALEASDKISNMGDETKTFGGIAEFNLFRFGADASAMSAANAEEAGEEHTLNDAVLKTESAGVKALVAAVQSEREVTVMRQISEMQEQLLSLGRERYKRGLLAAQEVDKLIIDWDNAKANLRDGEIRLARARADLKALLGAAKIKKDWPWKDRLQGKAIAFTEATEIFGQRPDYKAAEKRAEGARKRMNQTWGKMLPSLDLRLTYNFVSIQKWNYNAPQWEGGLILSIPLFDRLSNFADYKEKVALSGKAEIDLEQTRRLAKSDWDAVRETFRISLETAKSRDTTLAVSRKLYVDNLRRFKEGLTNANDLTVDQNRLYNTELLAVKGWSSVHLVFSDLCHAQGLMIPDCLNNLSN